MPWGQGSRPAGCPRCLKHGCRRHPDTCKVRRRDSSSYSRRGRYDRCPSAIAFRIGRYARTPRDTTDSCILLDQSQPFVLDCSALRHDFLTTPCRCLVPMSRFSRIGSTIFARRCVIRRDAVDPSLLLPAQRPVPHHLAQLQPLRLAPVEDRLDDIRRRVGERQEPADVRIRHALVV